MAGTRMVAMEMEKCKWTQDLIWQLHRQDLLIDWVWFTRRERNPA